MNTFIHFPGDKTKFKILVFPETFRDDVYQFQALQNSISKNFRLGYLNSKDLEVTLSDENDMFGIVEMKNPEINFTKSKFPSKFKKYIKFSHQKGNEWLRKSQRHAINQPELWEKVYWASMYLDEYGRGDYDFIVVGDHWLEKFDEKPQYNTVSFSDLLKIVRAQYTAQRNYSLDAKESRFIRYDFFYTVQSAVYFYNFMTLWALGHDKEFLKSYSSHKQRDIKEALSSLGNRLKNIIMSYDELNYELFLPSYSSRADYRISNFFSECVSAFEDIARLLITLFSNKDRKDTFSSTMNLFHRKIKRMVKKDTPNFYKAYNNQEIQDRFNVVTIIRNKMRHGEAINIQDWHFEGEILKVPLLKLHHLQMDEELIKNCMNKNNLFMEPFWIDEKDKLKDNPPTGVKLPLRETLDFSFDSTIFVINELTGALIEDILQMHPKLKNKYNRWELLQQYCQRSFTNFFEERKPTVHLYYAPFKFDLIKDKDQDKKKKNNTIFNKKKNKSMASA